MSPAPARRNVLGLLAAFVASAVVAGLLAAGLAMPAIGASGVAAKNSVNLFNSLPSDLETPPNAQRSTLEASDGSTIAQFYDEDRTDVTLAQIAPVMQKAIVAIEDSRFYQHGGIDPKGLLRALAVNQINGSIEQGGSTLTQQYVKNVLLENATAANDKKAEAQATAQTKSRKLQEIRYAITVEKEFSKDEILDRYLNIVNFGGAPPVYGIQAAAKHFFNVNASKLSLPQAALLAGMVNAPNQWDPVRFPKDALARRNVVLARMYQLHIIDQPTYAATVKTKIKLHLTTSIRGCAYAKPAYSAYFCQYVYNYIVKNNAFSSLGATQDDRETTINRGGLTIKTTLDPKIEQQAWLSSKQAVPTNTAKDGTAAVTVQPGTGKILAMAQDRYFLGTGKGHTEVNWSVDYQYGGSGGFQTGSSFKPFTLATWLKDGHSLNQTVSAASQAYTGADFKSCVSLAGVTWNPSNSEGAGKGSMSVLRATAASVNTAYAHIEEQLNLCDIAKTAESMGVYKAQAVPFGCYPDPKAVNTDLPDCQPTITLGPNSLSPLTQAAAYATFAAQGMYCQPMAVTSITGLNGQPYAIPKASCKQVLDKKVANTVTYALTKVLQPGGTGAAIGALTGNHPAAGKTGTSNDGEYTWFVGYTPQAATAVFVGRVVGDNNFHGYRTINGRNYNPLFGADLAGPSWRRIMDAAEAGLSTVQFAAADNKLVQGASTGIPNVAGEKVSDAINDLSNAGFSPKVGGTASSSYPSGRVASTSPGAGTPAKPGATVTITLSSGSGGANAASNNGGTNNTGGTNDTGLGAILGNVFRPPGKK